MSRGLPNYQQLTVSSPLQTAGLATALVAKGERGGPRRTTVSLPLSATRMSPHPPPTRSQTHSLTFPLSLTLPPPRRRFCSLSLAAAPQSHSPHTAKLPGPRRPAGPGPAAHSGLSPRPPHSFSLSVLRFPLRTFCSALPFDQRPASCPP